MLLCAVSWCWSFIVVTTPASVEHFLFEKMILTILDLSSLIIPGRGVVATCSRTIEDGSRDGCSKETVVACRPVTSFDSDVKAAVKGKAVVFIIVFEVCGQCRAVQ